LRGRVVSGGREAVIVITVLNDFTNGATEVEAIIDTGFTGHLTLPPEMVRSFSLPKRGFVEAELADGGVASLEVFDVRLLWHGEPRRVPVYVTGGAPLVGMSLLRGSRLTVEVVPGGEVAIEERV
jgi:clan AA aspartic protease